jgi:hypothetical protein
MKRRDVLLLAAAWPLRAASLEEQSIAALLDGAFPGAAFSFLLLDARATRIVAARWGDADRPAPAGSLLKPFLALAYAETHRAVFPAFTCDGTGCWRPRGHGPLDFVEAVAQSCNAYFLALAADTERTAIERIAARFGLNAPPAQAGPEDLIGLGHAWQNPALAIARAYGELPARAEEPGMRALLHGLARSASRGTAQGAGAGAYAKTGTANCVHQPRHAGDGLALAVFPAASPRFALLVRAGGVPGAAAALSLGRMRRMLESTP